MLRNSNLYWPYNDPKTAIEWILSNIDKANTERPRRPSYYESTVDERKQYGVDLERYWRVKEELAKCIPIIVEVVTKTLIQSGEGLDADESDYNFLANFVGDKTQLRPLQPQQQQPQQPPQEEEQEEWQE